MRIGHISDLHVLRLAKIRPWDFASKRIVGGMNLLGHRAGAHSVAVVQKAFQRLEDLGVDHICISGDLTNLALPSEFEAARELVDEIPNAIERVSVVPGNHDYYTFRAARNRRFETYFAPYLQSDLPEYQLASGYPFCHLRGDVAIVGLNSGVPSLPMMAYGRVANDELEALDRLLGDPRLSGFVKIVMVHHPLLPYPYAKIQASRHLHNADDLVRILRNHAVDLAIHGHNHYVSTSILPHLKGTGNLVVCEAGSTSNQSPSAPEFAGSFNIFDVVEGHLERIETHIYDGFEDTFVHWREDVFERKLGLP